MVSIIGFTGFVGQNLISFLNNYKISAQGIYRQALNESVLCLIDNTNTINHVN